MQAVTIPLSEDEMRELERRARQLGYEDARAFALALIVGELVSSSADDSAPAHLMVRSREDVAARLVEGIDSGPTTEMTEGDWAEIRRQALGRASQRRAKAS